MPWNHSRSARLARTTLTLIGVAVTALAGAALASARTGDVGGHAAGGTQAVKRAHVAGRLPAEGIFARCDIATDLSTCEQDLEAMHQSGLQVAVTDIPPGATLAELSAYAAAAQSTGMSVMWELADADFWGATWTYLAPVNEYAEFSSACGCTNTDQILTYMIQWLAALPATYGYYAADADDDAIDPSQLGPVTQYIDEIKAADPNHMVMMGTRESQGTSLYASGATMGNEIYPETSGSLMPVERNLDIWDSVQDSITQDARAAQRDGEPSAFILQSFTFGDNLSDGEAVGFCTPQMTQQQCASLLDFPSAAVQLQLRNEVLEHSDATLILWFNFDETYGQGNRWAGLTSAINAPYPVIATLARAKHSSSHRKTERRRAHRRRDVHSKTRRRRGKAHRAKSHRTRHRTRSHARATQNRTQVYGLERV